MVDKDTSRETPSLTGNQDKAEGTAAYSTGRKHLREAETKVKLMLVMVSFFIYVVLFVLLHYKIDYGMGITSIIPVVVVAWLYGSVPGMCAAVLTFFANILLREYLGQEWIQKIVMEGAGILGAVANIFVGAAVGRMSDLSRQVRIKLYEHAQAEEKLLEYRNHLEDLIKERTEELEQKINEHKQSEEKLRETKDHLDNVIESSLDCIMVSDRTGHIVRVNKYFSELLYYGEEEVVGKHIMECTPMTEEGTYECTTGEVLQMGKEFADDANRMISKLVEEGKITNWETYYFRKDKKVVPVEQNIVCLYNKQGERTSAVAIIRDITERRKAERESRESKEFLESIIENSKDAIIITDEKGSNGRAVLNRRV